MTMSPIRNVDLLKVALLFAALFAALLTLHTGACGMRGLGGFSRGAASASFPLDRNR
jgi:hypothetical protein